MGRERGKEGGERKERKGKGRERRRRENPQFNHRQISHWEEQNSST